MLSEEAKKRFLDLYNQHHSTGQGLIASLQGQLSNAQRKTDILGQILQPYRNRLEKLSRYIGEMEVEREDIRAAWELGMDEYSEGGDIDADLRPLLDQAERQQLICQALHETHQQAEKDSENIRLKLREAEKRQPVVKGSTE